jgi:hypothetical protein
MKGVPAQAAMAGILLDPAISTGTGDQHLRHESCGLDAIAALAWPVAAPGRQWMAGFTAEYRY